MKTPLSWKIKSVIFGFIRRICNHYYGCCNNITAEVEPVLIAVTRYHFKEEQDERGKQAMGRCGRGRG